MKFDKKIKLLLNEINIASVAGGFAGGFLRGAKDPGQALMDVGKELNKSEEDKKFQKPVSPENPIKEKTQTFCYTEAFVYDNTIPQWQVQPITLNGISLTKSDNLGNFKVQIADPDYVFFKRTSVDTKNKIKRIVVCIGKKSNLDSTGLSTTVLGNQYMVGPTRNDLDPSLKTWYFISKEKTLNNP
jgi:hypothetical protein